MNKNIKILIINSNNTATKSSEAIVTTLHNFKLEDVEVAATVKDGLQLIVDSNTNNPYEVVFLHELSTEDDVQLIKSLLEINPQQYVVILTDSITPEKILNCIRAGASGILSKPYSPDKLRLELDKFSFLREDKKIVAS